MLNAVQFAGYFPDPPGPGGHCEQERETAVECRPEGRRHNPRRGQKILLEIGAWLKVNGEAIYGTGVWRKPAEGPTQIVEGQFADSEAKQYTREDIRFTVKGGCPYAICLNMQGEDNVCIKSLAEADASKAPNFHGIIKRVEALGCDSAPEWARDEEGLKVRTLPAKDDKPVVFKIWMD